MATATSDVDDIRRQMAQIRHELHQDVKGVVAVTDWHRHLRSHPWLILGATAALGYLIVPRRYKPTTQIQAIPVPAESLAQTVHEAPKKKASKGLVGLAWGMLGPVAIRAAQSYAVGYLESLIAQQQHGPGIPPVGPSSRPDRPAGSGHPTGK